MATIHTTYTDTLRTEATHLQSGNKLLTDAPTDNKGKGEAFSPTDLLATAVGSCMLTIMGIAAQNGGFSIDGTTLETTKVMKASPRRVGEIICLFTFPKQAYSERQITLLKRAADTCPVAKSLHPDIQLTLTFKFNA
ncbi:MAG: osmotically inducible protein OsmC [Bacteroidetes bacterium]|nr:MAG: osmotically inducible protein OsmC [Bacteroidota bacterium]PIE88413.1 MAG: osmotically inducible protein OsmC [Bacteroidota bacterium]